MASSCKEAALTEEISYDDDDEEEEADDETFWSEIVDGWRQHFVAILVAVLATFAAHRYTIINSSGGQNQTHTSPVRNVKKHAHLDSYQRTANISFCILDAAEMRNDADACGDSLVPMDFTLSKEWLNAMKAIYHADIEESMGSDPSPELECLLQRQDVRGMTCFYKAPTIQSMYPKETKRRQENSVLQRSTEIQAAHLTFRGFAAKFFNLSPKPVLLFWDGRGERQRRLVGEIPPFESLGTATTPGQSFSVSPVYDSTHALDRWVVTNDDCLVYYEPENQELQDDHLLLYQMQKLNKEFAKEYLIHARRPWLAQFPRAFPVHPMWQARAFEQMHKVDTDLGTLTMTVESVTPRVFSIPGFLSESECLQLIELANHEGMKQSTVYSGGLAAHMQDLSTRSSSNTWLERDTAALTDRIYRRAAQVLRIDESLLQAPIDDEVHAHHHSIAESLQVVRYRKGEEYTAHHDFVYPPSRHRLQPTRFATLLLYLNDDFEGGQTVFPRAVNAKYHEGITIEPKRGTAVLFYNVLPDGNVDDLSQHSSQPLKSGEKLLANLWIWEPLIN